MKDKTMEEIGVDFSSDPNSAGPKNTLFVVDPQRPFVIDVTSPKNMEYNLPTYNLTGASALQPHVWGEEDIVREDVREDVRDGKEEVNFRSFIKTETSM